MAKISVAQALNRMRRIRMMTVLACLLLVVAIGQMTLFRGGKQSQAGVVPPQCNIKSNGAAGIPASCEGKDVAISYISVDAGAVRVWQKPGSIGNACSTASYSKTIGFITYSFAFDHIDTRLFQPCVYYSARGSKSEYKNFASASYSAGDSCDVVPTGYTVDSYTPASYQDCDSKRHFSSISLSSGAVLTHSAVTLTDMSQDVGGYTKSGSNEIANSLVDNVTGDARWKKVDIIADGFIYIDGSSSINVDEKGYPGTVQPDGATCFSYPNTETAKGLDGFGRGHGTGVSTTNNISSGGGAGYGGLGQSGTAAAGGIYDTDYVTQFDFGSSGGNSTKRNGGNFCSHWRSGNGGGRVRLDTGKINLVPGSKISANGQAAGSYAGSGSGGSIFVVSSDSTSTGFVALVKNATNGAGEGSVRSVDADTTIVSTVAESPNLISIGGAGGNLGAGGRIYTQKKNIPAVTIEKTLRAINRNGNANFNPYALQKGDIVEVNIKLKPHVNAVNLIDNFLSTNSNSTDPAKCVYDTGDTGLSVPNLSGSRDDNTMLWINQAASTSETLYTYQCRVQ